MDKSNIAFYLANTTGTGGTERACISVVNGLATKKQYNVFLLTNGSKEDEFFFTVHPNVKILYLGVKNYKIQFITLIFNAIRICKRNKISTLVAVEVLSLLMVYPILLFGRCIKFKPKLIVWEHFNFTVNLGKNLRDKFRRIAARHADAIVVLTQKDSELWKNNLKVKAKIKSIGNPSPFLISKDKYKSESLNIIAVGRLTYQKGFDKLLDIWKSYCLEHPNSNWTLQIIGSGPDKEKLLNKTKNLSLSQIEFIDNTPNIEWFYKNAAFLVMTSRFEGLPMTLIEAQSFALPIIAYDCLTGPSEVINNKNGFLVEYDNKKEFTDKIKILTSDMELRNRMSLQSKEDVLKYSLDNIIKQWECLIKKLK